MSLQLPTPAEPAQNKAYMWIEASISDPQRFADYARAMLILVPAWGGRYLVLGGEQQALEGEFAAQRMVVSEWPSMAAARAFWFSDAYADVRSLREGTGSFRVRLLESLDPTTPAPEFSP